VKEALKKRWKEALDTHDSEDSSTPERWIAGRIREIEGVPRSREIVGVPRSQVSRVRTSVPRPDLPRPRRVARSPRSIPSSPCRWRK